VGLEFHHVGLQEEDNYEVLPNATRASAQAQNQLELQQQQQQHQQQQPLPGQQRKEMGQRAMSPMMGNRPPSGGSQGPGQGGLLRRPCILTLCMMRMRMALKQT
jgi:hypothetical protein